VKGKVLQEVIDILFWRGKNVISVKSNPGFVHSPFWQEQQESEEIRLASNGLMDIWLSELMVNCVISEDHVVAFTADGFNLLGFDILTAVVMKSVIFCDMTLCCPVDFTEVLDQSTVSSLKPAK
jgi:hypothetical protein